MIEFEYKGVNKTGQPIAGLIEAVDQRSAVAELTAKGHFATNITEKTPDESIAVDTKKFSLPKLGEAKITSKDILAMTNQLSTALSVGLPLLNALNIIEAQQHKPPMKNVMAHLGKAVSSGESLSDAMSDYTDIFSPLYISMVRVGETGGILDKTMKQLTGLLEREDKVRTNMKNAMAYPAIVLTVGLISVIIMLTAILPKIINTLGEDILLPLPTRMLLVMSDFTIYYGWLVAIILAAASYYFVKWKRTSEGRLKWDSLLLKIPILGSVLTKIAVGRFARTLGSLTLCGITILKALTVVRDTLGNELLSTKIDEVSEGVRMGTSVAEPMSNSGYFPPLLVQIVSIGEQTGKLDELLLNAADTFDEEADAAITRFMAIFPAFLIMILALIIFFIIAATLLPIVAMELGGVGL